MADSRRKGRVMEVRVPVSDRVRSAILRREWKEHERRIQSTPTSDVIGRYEQMGRIGQMLKAIFLRSNYARVKAFENPELLRFLKNFIKVAKSRAKEMGYRYEDIDVSMESGITENGVIEVKFIPRPGAQKQDGL